MFSTAATTVRTYDDSPNGLNTSDADSDTNGIF